MATSRAPSDPSATFAPLTESSPSFETPTAPLASFSDVTAPWLRSGVLTASLAIAGAPTALGRSFAALTVRLPGTRSCARVREERSEAVSDPLRIFAPVTEFDWIREPEIDFAARCAAAGPSSAKNRASRATAKAGDGRRTVDLRGSGRMVEPGGS